MNISNVANSRLDFITKNYIVKNTPMDNANAIKSNMTQDEFLNKNMDSYNKTINSFENTMYQDVTDFKNNLYDSVNGDSTDRIDSTIDKSKQYTEYINNNFQGEEKNHYLDVLDQAMSYAKSNIAEQVSTGISDFLNLSEEDTKNMNDNIISIIDDRTNGKVNVDKSSSNLNMDYDGLRTLSSAINVINKDVTIRNGVSLLDSSGRTSYLGLAMMKTNFIVEKTNLPDKLKKQLSDAVTSKVEVGMKGILTTQAIFENGQNMMATEKNIDSNDSIYTWDNNIVSSKVKSTINNLYKKFSTVNFNGTDFRAQFSNLLTSINDNLASDWNDFIDHTSIKEDKSIYYFPASNHNVVDTLA